MVFNRDTAFKTAEFLLQIKAIQLRTNPPFVWASGWQSPIYCDNRVALSFPLVRTYLREQMVKLIRDRYDNAEVLAGVATGAIALGALVAESLNLPFVYVRPEPKGHGKQNQVEGFLEKGKRVVVIEDLISTGGSSLKAVHALRAHEAQVQGMVAIFTYGFEASQQAFEQAQCAITTLSDYEHLLEQSVKTGYISENEQEILKNWRHSPQSWKP